VGKLVDPGRHMGSVLLLLGSSELGTSGEGLVEVLQSKLSLRRQCENIVGLRQSAARNASVHRKSEQIGVVGVVRVRRADVVADCLDIQFSTLIFHSLQQIKQSTSTRHPCFCGPYVH
jgi:hypothetical protein